MSIEFSNVNKMVSCALIVLVLNDKVYTSALGNSQAIILSKPEDKKDNNEKFPVKYARKLGYDAKIFNYPQSANFDLEQKRLKIQFPTEPDIITCLKNRTAK
jgi:hypothetical protein